MRNIRNLITALCELAIHDHQEFTFQSVVNAANDNDVFEYMMDGRRSDGDFVLTAKARSRFGLTLGRYAPNIDVTGVPRSYVINGKKVMFGTTKQGKNKRYFITQEAGTCE